jgi:hypothetical protein
MPPRKIFTAAERFRVLERDGFCCVYCGKSAVDGVCLSVAFHLDHVYPRSRGGSDLMSNLATSCSDCNAGKGDSVLSQLPPGINGSVEAGFARHCKRNDVVEEVVQESKRIPAWDRELIETLLCSHAMCVEVVGAVVVDELESEAFRAIFNAANAIIAQGEIVTCDSLCNRTQDPSVFELLVSVQSRRELHQYSDADMINHFRCAMEQRAADRAVEEGIGRLMSCDLSAEEEAAILNELVSVRREAQGWVAES